MISNTEFRKRLSRIKLIVTDVDGTLTNDKDELGEDTLYYSKKLQNEKGIKITFATQRIHSSIVKYAEQMDINIPFMTVNGALIKGLNGTIISKSVIPPNRVRKALDLAKFYFVRVALCFNDVILYTEDNSVLKDYMHRIGTDYVLVKDYYDYLDDVIEIIMLGNEKNVIKHIQNKLNFPFKLFLTAKYYRSNSNLGVFHLEIRKSGTSKKTGLNKIARFLNVKRSEIAVVGDWYNDRELFECGCLNIAVQNAVPEIKHMAHFITKRTNNEDAMGEFLKLVYENTP